MPFLTSHAFLCISLNEFLQNRPSYKKCMRNNESKLSVKRERFLAHRYYLKNHFHRFPITL